MYPRMPIDDKFAIVSQFSTVWQHSVEKRKEVDMTGINTTVIFATRLVQHDKLLPVNSIHRLTDTK